MPVLNRTFEIPPGEARHDVRASCTVPPGGVLRAIGIHPHVHLLGREIEATATYPDGRQRA